MYTYFVVPKDLNVVSSSLNPLFTVIAPFSKGIKRHPYSLSKKWSCLIEEYVSGFRLEDILIMITTLTYLHVCKAGQDAA
jgi:hypothetical protein